MKDGLRLAMLTSGGATTAREIIRACKSGRLNRVIPVLFVTSNPEAGGVEKAREEGIRDEDILILRPKYFPKQPLAFGEALLENFRRRGIDVIGQYGWLPLTPASVVEEFSGRIFNQHPGPLRPNGRDFGGKGMFGKRVHCARLLFVRETKREYWTEVVTHRVTAEFDRGAVVRKRVVPILPGDDVSSLQERALPEEHETQIEALEDLMNNRLQDVSRTEPVVWPEETALLQRCKDVAIKLYPKG